MADHPDDQKISQYAKMIMQEDPAEVLDRMNSVVREEEMIDF